MTEGTISVEDIIKIDKKYSDGWQGMNKLKALTNDAPEGTLSRLMWEGYRNGQIDLVKYHNNLEGFATVTDAYDGSDVIGLLEELIEFDKQKGYTYSYSSFDLPGVPAFITRALKERPDDKEFGTFLASKWKDFPAPYGPGLAAALAGAGHLEVEELPEELIDDLAKAYLIGTSADWADLLPWSDEEWARALIRAAAGDGVEKIENDEHVLKILEVATPQELVVFLSKIKLGFNEKLPVIEAAAESIVEDLPAVEEAILALPGVIPADHDQKVPVWVPLLTYYRACHLVKQWPSKELDGRLSEGLGYYRPGWSGSRFEEHHERMQWILKAAPQERLSKAMLEAENTPWLLIPAASTPEVCARVASDLAALDKTKVPYNFDTHRAIALSGGGETMAAALMEVIEPGGGWQREALVTALGRMKEPIAAPKLVEMLADKTKGVTEAAKNALLALPTTVVLEHIEEALEARRKGTRLAAAEVLQALPPTLKAWEFAQTALESEKTADVKDVLAAVIKGEKGGGASEVDGQLKEKILAAFEKNYEAWEDYVHEPETAMEAALERLGESQSERAAGYHITHNFLPGLLKAGAESAEVRRRLVGALGGFYPSSGKELLSDCIEVVPDFADDVAQAFIQGRISRPPEFGPPPKWGKSFESLDALEWLIDEAPEAAFTACLGGLQDSSKVVRDISVEFLAENAKKLNVEEDVLPLLGARTKDPREAAVKLLAALEDPAYVPVLEEALEKERSKGVKKLINTVIVNLTAKSLNPEEFADDKKGNAALAEALAELPAANLPDTVDKAFADLPALGFSSGGQLKGDGLRWFLAEICGSGGEQAREVRSRLVDEDCHQLCDILIELNGGQDELGWALNIQSYLAGPDQVESLGSRLEKFASSQSYGWGDFAVDTLVELGTDQAARILDDWAQRTRKNALKKRASSGVYRIAAARGVSQEELMEQALGSFGFDEDGAQRFDFGSRVIVVRLSPTGDDLLYEDEEGSTFKSMPRARKADDDELASAARSRVSQIKKDLKRVRRTQTRRLEQSMVGGRRWLPSVWMARYGKHPLLRAFGFGLVWGIYDLDNRLVGAFQLDDDAAPVDLDFEEPELSDESHRVGIAHPLELGEDVQPWLTTLADYERVQPFEQLKRPVFTRDDVSSVNEFIGRRGPLEAGRFLGALNRLGYELGPREDAGAIGYSYRRLGEAVIGVNHTGFAPEWMDAAGMIDVESIYVRKDGEVVDLDKVSDLIFSEVIHDLHELTGE